MNNTLAPPGTTGTQKWYIACFQPRFPRYFNCNVFRSIVSPVVKIRCQSSFHFLLSLSLSLSQAKSHITSDEERRENRKYRVRKVGPSWFSTSARWQDGGSGATRSRGDRRLSISSAVAIKHYRWANDEFMDTSNVSRCTVFCTVIYPSTLVRLLVYSGCLVNIGLLWGLGYRDDCVSRL